MNVIRIKRPFKFNRNFKLAICMVFLVFIIVGNTFSATAPNYIPFSRDNAAILLQKTVEAKLIPCVIENNGLKLTITKLLDFSMDWEKAQFTLACAFTADSQGFFKLNESGEVILSGSGLISKTEQKIGVKLLEIKELKLKHSVGLISEAARVILDKSLSGKELWQAGPPDSSETLTKDNFTTLLMVALNQELPMTITDNASSVTLIKLDDIALMSEPGQLQARFALKGTSQQLITIPFEGEATVGVSVFVDPDAMAGLIRIEKLTDLKLKGAIGLLDGIIRGLINNKLKGKETQFVWK